MHSAVATMCSAGNIAHGDDVVRTTCAGNDGAQLPECSGREGLTEGGKECEDMQGISLVFGVDIPKLSGKAFFYHFQLADVLGIVFIL